MPSLLTIFLLNEAHTRKQNKKNCFLRKQEINLTWFHLRSKVFKVSLDVRAFPKAKAPSSLILLFLRSRCVRFVLSVNASAKWAAPSHSIWFHSRETNEKLFDSFNVAAIAAAPIIDTKISRKILVNIYKVLENIILVIQFYSVSCFSDLSHKSWPLSKWNNKIFPSQDDKSQSSEN